METFEQNAGATDDNLHAPHELTERTESVLVDVMIRFYEKTFKKWRLQLSYLTLSMKECYEDIAGNKIFVVS